jgi:hypothetical protein
MDCSAYAEPLHPLDRERPMQLTRICFAALVACWSTAVFGQEIEQTFGRRPVCQPNCPPNCPPLMPCPPGAGSPQNPANPAAPDANQSPGSNSFNDALASAGEGGTQPTASYNPAFFGDLLGGFGLKFSNTSDRLAFLPINSHSGGYKITDYESPAPADRVYYAYNEYSYVNYSSNTNVPPINLERHVIGLEKTLFDGFISVGMRIPFVITSGPPELTNQQLGDMSFILKMALWNNRQTGNVFSVGLAVTVPTGPQDVLTLPDTFAPYTLNDTILQPYFGYVYNFSPRFYTQGFCSVAVPTDPKDVTILFNDVSFGVWLYKNPDDSFIRGFVPTVEFHLNTPLNHEGKESGLIGFSELADMTCGAYVVFPRSTLGAAVGFPMTGPTPFGVEAVMQFTLRF